MKSALIVFVIVMTLGFLSPVFHTNISGSEVGMEPAQQLAILMDDARATTTTPTASAQPVLHPENSVIVASILFALVIAISFAKRDKMDK